MKSKLSFVLVLSLLVLFCAPGIKAEINPYYKTHLDLPSVNPQQAPVVYTAGYGYTSFGIKVIGALSLGTLRYSEEDQVDDEILDYKNNLLGFAGGIGFETGGQVGVEVDLLYIQKGANFKGTEIDLGGGDWITVDADMIINQLAVPVMLRFKFMPGTGPYILLGGSVAYILSATAKYSMSDNYGNSDQGEQDLFEQEGDTLSRLDYSVVGGGGLELMMGTMRLYFEGRFIYGLANLIHPDARADDEWMKASTILILFGLGF